MTRFGYLTWLGIFMWAGIAEAQLRDTTYLKEVRVYGLPVNTYSIGSKVEQIKTDDDVVTLSDKLIEETSLYLKTYGNNQLSTVTIRGTTASQTAVLWNGMNINSPTLGQTDFSLIPLFLFDEVSIRYGTASALYGSDAIGGSVMIGQRPARFKKGFTATFHQQAGSFGKLNTGLKFSLGNDRWEFRTKLYRAFIENDFPYNSPAVGYRKKQNQASVENYGIDQQIHLKISDSQQLSAEGMYTHNFRKIQPPVTNDISNETLRDDNVRISLSYQNDSRVGILSATAGYLSSDQDYYDDVTSTVKSKQFTAMASMDKSLNAKANLRYGINYSRYEASAENFGGTISESRYDAFVSIRYAFRQYWLMNVNLRQSLYAEKYAPFAPTVGTEVHVLHRENNNVKVRAQVARGYRVPTLNDRYWIPGGNPNITPEDAIQIEGGVNWAATVDKYRFSVDATAYKGWVNDMIVWMPMDNVWSPTNLQEVHLHGVEVNAKAALKKERYVVKGNFSYSYTRSVNKKGLNAFDQSTVNKQLAYVPMNTAKASASFQRGTWDVDLRLNLTGLRYISLDNERTQSLDPYALTDLSVGKQISAKRFVCLIRAEALNIFDVYYENLNNHAMPGRNYSINLTINYNNKQTL